MSKDGPEALLGMQADAVHYCYELRMLASMTFALDELLTGTPEGDIRALMTNALLESYLVHVRCLADFFYPRPTARDDQDILARHFVAFPDSDDASAAHLKGVRPIIDGRLAHLTRRRHAEFKGYVVLVTTGAVIRTSEHFLKRLKEVDRDKAQWFADARVTHRYFHEHAGTQWPSILDDSDLLPE